MGKLVPNTGRGGRADHLGGCHEHSCRTLAAGAAATSARADHWPRGSCRSPGRLPRALVPNTGRGGGCHECSCRSLAAGVVPITWAAATSTRAEHWPRGRLPRVLVPITGRGGRADHLGGCHERSCRTLAAGGRADHLGGILRKPCVHQKTRTGI